MRTAATVAVLAALTWVGTANAADRADDNSSPTAIAKPAAADVPVVDSIEVPDSTVLAQVVVYPRRRFYRPRVVRPFVRRPAYVYPPYVVGTWPYNPWARGPYVTTLPPAGVVVGPRGYFYP